MKTAYIKCTAREYAAPGTPRMTFTVVAQDETKGKYDTYTAAQDCLKQYVTPGV